MPPQPCLTSGFSLGTSVSWHFSPYGDSSFLVWSPKWIGLTASSSCANQQNVICIFCTLFSQKQEREHQVAPKWERDGMKIAFISFCSPFPSPPTGADNRRKRRLIGKGWLIQLISEGLVCTGVHLRISVCCGFYWWWCKVEFAGLSV